MRREDKKHDHIRNNDVTNYIQMDCGYNEEVKKRKGRVKKTG